ALAGVFGVGEGQLLHRETQDTGSAYFTRFGKSSSGFPIQNLNRPRLPIKKENKVYLFFI
ncbi:hypothetical protein ACNFH5_30350, partial [Pseudomonas sp. NY15435]|uniref:hypothetical protein n=1 Tax=Pseudomonas sp. NY15435 TaxID=3400358 RepID=UPI003A87FCF5